MNIVRAFIEARQRISANTAAQTSVGMAAGQIVSPDEDRKGVIIQNTGTTVIKLVLGSGTPTQTVYHMALGACAGANDGTGGIYVDDSWTDAIQAISSGAGGTIAITEIF